MVANRRTRYNFALQRAVELARELEPPAGRARGPALRLPVGLRAVPPLRARRDGGQRGAVRTSRRLLSRLRGAPRRRGERPSRRPRA